MAHIIAVVATVDVLLNSVNPKEDDVFEAVVALDKLFRERDFALLLQVVLLKMDLDHAVVQKFLVTKLAN